MKFSEQAKMLSQWIDQVGDLIDSRVLPDIPRGLVRSLYMVVSGIQSSGVKRRPSFPFQSDVMGVLHDYFKTNRPQSVTMLPHFTLASTVDPPVIANELQLSWDYRAKRVHEQAKQVQEWRRNPQLRF